MPSLSAVLPGNQQELAPAAFHRALLTLAYVRANQINDAIGSRGVSLLLCFPDRYAIYRSFKSARNPFDKDG
jgi:hypothetical protein